MKRSGSFISSLLVSIAGSPLLWKFNRQSRNVKKAQERVLSDIIRRNKETLFGKEHGFKDIDSVRKYKESVPIMDYEDHRPYIERMQKGERDLLIKGKPLMYNTSSGTTTLPKYIPISENYMKSYSALNKLWLYTCLKENPRLYNGYSMSAVSPAVEGYCKDGTPYGSTSGTSYLNIPKVLKKTYSVPYPALKIPDYSKKYYAIARGAAGAYVSFIISPSPSNIIKIHETIMENFEEIVKDVYDGTLRKDVFEEIEDDEKEEIENFFSPDPERAKTLESLMHDYGEGLRPKHYWPDLVCVNTWKQGNFRRIIPMIEEYFSEDTPIRAFGYQASEARAGCVLGNDWDYSVLAAGDYFFEFYKSGSDPAVPDNVFQCHELTEGETYYILISNNSGLYRYDINDLVKVRGFYGTIPLIEFIGKGSGVTSITGEKLTENHVIHAVEMAEKEFEHRVEFFIMFCDEESLRYTLFVEFDQRSKRGGQKHFVNTFDEKLMEINPEYKIKRRSGRLSKPGIRILRNDSYNGFKEMCVRRGIARDGQYKDFYLRKERVYLEILKELEE
ncbi:MAG: GH3 auxin-responsive promoter family protein [Chitinivibrionales bacterium]